jgi:hypothetical protein
MRRYLANSRLVNARRQVAVAIKGWDRHRGPP